jgi:hypothetical protein
MGQLLRVNHPKRKSLGTPAFLPVRECDVLIALESALSLAFFHFPERGECS